MNAASSHSGRSEPAEASGATDASHPAAPTAAAAHAAWLQAFASRPEAFDFYQVLRRFEAAHPHLPRLGEALRPADEPLRLSQPADLSFAPAPMHSVRFRNAGPPNVTQRIFGLLGPNGPLPTHLTELASERLRHHGDAGLQRFLDLLAHRFGLLFYRAWAQAQPTLGFDRPGDSPWAARLGALSGIGNPALQQRDALDDAAKLHFTGRLARQARDAEGLLAWCCSEFDVPLRIEQWRGHWMPLGGDERSRLGGLGAARRRAPGAAGVSNVAGAGVGQGAVLGAAVWDVQHKFRIVIGPLTLERYCQFLPGGTELARLQAMVRQWVGLELRWDLRLILKHDEVPRSLLGRHPPGRHQGERKRSANDTTKPTGSDTGGARLGRTGWLGHYRKSTDAGDLTLDVEQTLSTRPRETTHD